MGVSVPRPSDRKFLLLGLRVATLWRIEGILGKPQIEKGIVQDEARWIELQGVLRIPTQCWNTLQGLVRCPQVLGEWLGIWR
jgi:hypothetical protein